MQILENQIDTDDFILNLNNKNEYTFLFLSLLLSPNTTTLNKLVINKLSRLISDLKYLIKYKYTRLTLNTRKNICNIIILLLDYNINIDSLLINLLRNDSYCFSINILKHKYFIEYKMSYLFIVYHLRIDISKLNNMDGNNMNNGRDFCGGNLYINTPSCYLSSGVSVEIETNLYFLMTISSNINWYIDFFINKYVADNTKARSIIRFIVTSTVNNKNIVLLLKEIVNKYKESKIWIFYDVLYYNGEETINDIVWSFDYSDMDVYKDKIHKNIKRIQGEKVQGSNITIQKNTNVNIQKTNIHTIVEILNIIRDITFDKYYTLIQNMKSNKTPFIPSNIYRNIILRSFDEDNYVQVYLWKILLYQKILFSMEIEVDEGELLSEESKEGYDIYISLV